MNVWILVFVALSLIASSQTCPPKHFSAVIVTTIEQTVEDLQIHHDDPELVFLKKVLKFDEVDHIFYDAMDFFNSTFGLDFSASPPNERYERFLDNARMHPYILRKDIYNIATANNWIRNGNTRSQCYRVYDGGIIVEFSADTTLYGKYGGDEGKPAGPYTPLVYGFYSIDACHQSPVNIHYRCPTPIRGEPIEQIYVSACYTYNRVLGRGRSHGIGTIRPDRDEPDKFRIDIKGVITFQGRGEQRDDDERE